MAAKARRLALNSTGNVTSWNTTDRPKQTIPKLMKKSEALPREEKRMPSKIRGMAILEPKLVTGIMAARSLMGAYPWAYCTAWPASWQATPMAAVEVLP